MGMFYVKTFLHLHNFSCFKKAIEWTERGLPILHNEDG